MENVMYTSGAAKALGLGVSTLRNYAVVLEAKGYLFERGSNNGRVFREEDLLQIREMMNRMAKEGITVDQAAEITAKNSEKAAVPTNRPKEKSHEGIEKLCEKISLLEKQQLILTEVNRKLAHQVERLTEKIEDRERDQLLFERRENTKNKKKRKGMAFLRSFISFQDKKTTI